MSKFLKHVGGDLTGSNISRISQKVLLAKDYTPKFVHQVGLVDNPVQKSVFNKTERSIYSNLLGDLQDQRKKNTDRRQKLNWGKYIQNHNSPKLVQEFNSSTFGPIPSVPKDIVHVPYPHSSMEHVKMKAMLELIDSNVFFVAASVGEGLSESYRRTILESQLRDCQEVNVKALPIKPILFQACLWSLSNNPSRSSECLDDFWTKGYLDTHDDILAKKVQTASQHITRGGHGTMVVYFFELHKDSHSVLEDIFEPYQEVCRCFGSRISPEVVGGSKRLKETLSNINTPWVLTGDENTKSLAKVLQGLASLGLVNGSQAPGGGIYVV